MRLIARRYWTELTRSAKSDAKEAERRGRLFHSAHTHQLASSNNRPLLSNGGDVSMVISNPSFLSPPSGLCFWVSPTIPISLIYTWTSAVVRYALSDPAAAPLLCCSWLSHHPPTTPTPLPTTAEVSGRRRDPGAVPSSLVRGDLGRLR